MFLSRRSIVALLMFSAACASNRAPIDDSAPSAKPAAFKANLISREELQDPRYVGGDALNAINRLRPAFLRQRAPVSFQANSAGSVQVSVDFGPLQNLNILPTIPTVSLWQVLLMTPEEAQLRFGLNANSGPVVVLLTSKDSK